MLLEAAGWDDWLRRVSFEAAIVDTLPATVDRFLEARFFALHVTELTPNADNLPAANWLVSAHLAAFIAVRDAARTDFERLGKAAEFDSSNLGRESS